MEQGIYIIEPLFEKLKSLLFGGFKGTGILRAAKTFYGRKEEDHTNLSAALKEIIENNEKESFFILIDFTPFSKIGIGHENLIKKGLIECKGQPVLAVIKRGIASELLRILDIIPIAVCDENCTLSDLYIPTYWDGKEIVRQYFQTIKRRNFYFLHSKWVSKRLASLIPNSIRKPSEGEYILLPDGTQANEWFDVKSIISYPEKAFFIAYQMGYILSKGYSQDLDADGFLVGNNIAYILASFLQLIFDDKELIIIDHLGPYPGLKKLRIFGEKLRYKLANKKLIIIEDVISMGRELDSLYLFAFCYGAEIERAISFLNLDVANPVIFDSKKLSTLCSLPPSILVDYERILKYKVLCSKNAKTGGQG